MCWKRNKAEFSARASVDQMGVLGREDFRVSKYERDHCVDGSNGAASEVGLGIRMERMARWA